MLVFVAMCSIFWLLLVKLSVLAEWLARKTLLRKPNHGEGSSRKPRPKSAYDFLGLLYCFTVLLCDCDCVVSWLYVIYFPTSMAWYSLFLLKVPLNTKQTMYIIIRLNSFPSCCYTNTMLLFCSCYLMSFVLVKL